MSDIFALPAASRDIIKMYAHRIGFWQRLPGHERVNFWAMDDGTPYFQAASDVVTFTKVNCVAAQAGDNSDILMRFKDELSIDLKMSKRSPFEGKQLEETLIRYVTWIDRLFFFGLLTHQTRRVATEPIITFHFHDEAMKNPAGLNLNGTFIYHLGEIHVSMRRPSGKPHFLAKAICILAHELAHAYLHALTRDMSASRFYREIMINRHGTQFWELLLFILTQLSNLMPRISYFATLASSTRQQLSAVLATPAVSDTAARSLIYSESVIKA